MKPKSLQSTLIIIIVTTMVSCVFIKSKIYPFSEVTMKDGFYYYDDEKIEDGKIFILEKNTDSTVLWLKEGKLWIKTRYNKGKEDDYIEEVYENNILSSRGNYKHGKSNGIHELYENGRLTNIIVYKDDKYNGIYDTYNEKGQLTSRYMYVNGEKNGIAELYDDKGQLTTRHTFKNDKLNGISEFNLNKEPYYAYIFKDDKIVGKPSSTVNSINQNNNSSTNESTDGIFIFESGYRRMRITITQENWFGWLEDGSGDGNYNGKTRIRGIIKGTDLYDEYGVEKRGYISGNNLFYNDPLGNITLSKQ